LVDHIIANAPVVDSQGLSEVVIDPTLIESNHNADETDTMELNETA
jgi:hypothetical protein